MPSDPVLGGGRTYWVLSWVYVITFFAVVMAIGSLSTIGTSADGVAGYAGR